MAELFLYILYALPGAAIAGYALAEMLIFGRLNFKSFSLFNIALMFFFVPLFIRITGDGVSPNFISYNFPKRLDLFFLFLPLASGTVFCFLLAYHSTTKFRYRIEFLMPSPIRFIFVLTAIGAGSWLTYIQLYGGLDYVLQNISRIRSGTDENKNYLGALFRIFSDFLIFAAFFSFSHYRAKTRWALPVFIILFAFAFGKLFLDGGRGGLINLFIGIYFIFVQSSGKIGFHLVMILTTVSYYIGTYGKILLFSLFTDIPLEVLLYNAAEASGGLANFVTEYSHQFLSTLIALEYSSVISDRFGVDLFVWLIKPLKLLGVPVPDSVSFYNTYLITGDWDSEVPPGIIALGLYNFGVPFFWISIFLWGILCATLDKSFRNSGSATDPNVRAMYAIFFVFLQFGLMNADPALLFQWLIGVISLVFFLRFFRFYKCRRAGGAG